MKLRLQLFVFGMVIGLGLFCFEQKLLGQNSKTQQDKSTATLRGNLVLDSGIIDSVDRSTIKGEIIQRVD